MKIAILGAGNMGVAFSRSFLKYELVKPQNLQLIVRNETKTESLKKEFPEIEISHFSEANVENADIVIISVKPQDFQFVVENLPFKLNENQMVLSIMAGVTIEKIQNLLQHKNVVRAMPNSPTLLGMGITGYTAAKEININQILQIEKLLNSSGRSVYFEEENLLDSVTALSGSGPAYFYYFVDAMIKAGIDMGIEENIAKHLVKQTMIGAYHLINNSDKNLDELIKEVASKGGTTEAALKVFRENSLKEIVENGIFAAEKRARELNG